MRPGYSRSPIPNGSGARFRWKAYNPDWLTTTKTRRHEEENADSRSNGNRFHFSCFLRVFVTPALSEVERSWLSKFISPKTAVRRAPRPAGHRRARRPVQCGSEQHESQLPGRDFFIKRHGCHNRIDIEPQSIHWQSGLPNHRYDACKRRVVDHAQLAHEVVHFAATIPKATDSPCEYW